MADPWHLRRLSEPGIGRLQAPIGAAPTLRFAVEALGFPGRPGADRPGGAGGDGVRDLSILIVGGGIGGLTAAVAFRQRGFTVTLIEKDPAQSHLRGRHYSAGQCAVCPERTLASSERYVDAGCALRLRRGSRARWDQAGACAIASAAPRLALANLGISRRALQKVLSEAATDAGAAIRLGITVEALEDRGAGVGVRFSSTGRRAHSILSSAPTAFLPKLALRSFRRRRPLPLRVRRSGATRYRAALTSMPCKSTTVRSAPVWCQWARATQYLYLTTPEPGNPRYRRQELAAADRCGRKRGACPRHPYAGTTDHRQRRRVVYRPLEGLLVGPWAQGADRAARRCSAHDDSSFGPGAGHAIEDSLVLAEELARGEDIEGTFGA